MDHAARVGVVERVGDFAQQSYGFDHLETSFAPESGSQRLPLDEWHRIPESTRGLARVEDGDDVRMLQPRDERHLTPKALGAATRRVVVLQHFECDRSRMPHGPRTR